MTAERRSRLPSPAAAILLFLIVATVNFASGYVFGALGLPESVFLVGAPTVMLVLTLAAATFLRVDPRQTFLLRLPSRADFFMAFPLAVSFVVLNDQLSTLTNEMFPLPEEMQQAMLELLRADGASEWALKVATIGLGAAVSEELLFRGFIQVAFLTSMGRFWAVVSTSLLFVIIHLLPLPSFAAAGVVLGIVALASRSILVPMLVHLVNNLAALAFVNLTDLESLGDPVWIPPAILLPALAIFVLAMGFYMRRLLPEDPQGRRGDEWRAVTEVKDDPVPVALAGPANTGLEDLEAVPQSRRRLGWLVVLVAVFVGVCALVGLFLLSAYFANPKGMQAAIIDSLEEESVNRLAPDALDRAPDLNASFDALSAVNEAGNLAWSQLWRVIVAYAEASADGTIDTMDVDAVMGVVADIVGAATVPRRL